MVGVDDDGSIGRLLHVARLIVRCRIDINNAGFAWPPKCIRACSKSPGYKQRSDDVVDNLSVDRIRFNDRERGV